jgi:hypothetical protein
VLSCHPIVIIDATQSSGKYELHMEIFCDRRAMSASEADGFNESAMFGVFPPPPAEVSCRWSMSIIIVKLLPVRV